jgi:hypothetical protein
MGKVTPPKKKVETVRVPSSIRDPRPPRSRFPGSNRGRTASRVPSPRVSSVRFADSQIPSTDFISPPSFDSRPR